MLKKMNVFGIFSLALSFFFSPISRADDTVAAPSVHCYQSFADGTPYGYCVHTVSTSTNTDVLYYLHGIGGSEYQWKDTDTYLEIYQLWGNSAPTVVSISYGPVWVLADNNGSIVSGLYPNFVNHVLPDIERKRNLIPRHRLLMGLSMGGLNATELYLKNPELFYEVGLACPAITDVGPWDGYAAIQAYTARTHASALHVDFAELVGQAYFPSEKDWLTAAPLTLVDQVTSASPPLFVSGGLQDQYGFFEGSAAFVTAVTAQGGKATWDPVQGGHCTYDWQAMALFFLD